MEFGLILIFGIGGLWMLLTTPEQRKMILYYLIFFSLLMSIVALITGQGPYSHYGP